MIEVILIALLIAKIKGYNLKPFFKSWAMYPIFIYEVIYIFLQTTIFLGDYRFVEYASIIKSIYLYLYLIPIIKYKKYYSAIIGSIFIFIGSTLNNVAIKVNNGSMPVFPTLSYWTGYVKEDSFIKINDMHVLGNSGTKLKFLTDIIDIGYSILSIGDIFIRCFAFIVIFNVIKEVNKEITQIN
ncbi:DUF5317 family protein [Clostridium peptidivorans]|uniref:DUF5317 family protein n=1 Tax=Clostridium peptidivorans TaxID=100174 RepID=UPI000BE2CF56|nr:DUF5317 family protein [Clostridium peptidivorans]